MGLDITSISLHGQEIKSAKYGSYSRIHILRQWVIVDHEKLTDGGDSREIYRDEILSKTRFPALVNHSDCDGGYLSSSQTRCVTSFQEPVEWNDLDLLQSELKLLAEVKDQMPLTVRSAFDDLWSFAMPSVGEYEEVQRPFLVVFH